MNSAIVFMPDLLPLWLLDVIAPDLRTMGASITLVPRIMRARSLAV